MVALEKELIENLSSLKNLRQDLSDIDLLEVQVPGQRVRDRK